LHPDDATRLAEQTQPFSFSTSEEVEARAEALLNSVSPAIGNDGPPLIDSAEDLGCTPYSREQAARLVKRFSAATEVVEATIRGILDGSEQNAEQLATVATDYTTEVVEDADQVIAMNEELGYSAEIAKRSVRMATLGMATGLKMRLDQEHCRELGVCALVHDLGIHGLPERLQDEKEPFSQDDWSEYRSHPYRTLDLLEHVHGLSDTVRLAASQVHENADGSGFPRGLSLDRIHPYARIVNVVDAYIHLTSTVRGRPAVFPYDALICILRHTKLGRFDPESVRPLVDLLSVFP
jgi:HD-GYP domain-containing protein (c-di-GMP phosphodiesterase class II)